RQQLQCRIDRLARRVGRIVEVDIGEIAQLQVADVAGQQLDLADTEVARRRIRYWPAHRASRFLAGRRPAYGEVAIHRPEPGTECGGQFARIGQLVERAGSSGAAQLAGDPRPLAGVEVRRLDGR